MVAWTLDVQWVSWVCLCGMRLVGVEDVVGGVGDEGVRVRWWMVKGCGNVRVGVVSGG